MTPTAEGPALRPRPALLAVHVFAWVSVCFFAVAPVSAAVVALADALGRPALAESTPFTVAVEALVHFALAAGAFWLARVPGLPRRYWLAAPVGYLAALAGQVAFMYLAGSTRSLPSGWEWAFVVADALAVSLGAWLVLRRPVPQTEAPAPPEPAS